VAAVAANACGVPTVGAAPQRESADLSVAPESGPGVLRQPVSVPLEALVEPLDLAKWVTPQTSRAAAAEALPASPAATDDPFVDDPPEVAGESIPWGRGVGRTLPPSAPLPSWSRVRERLPSLPKPLGRVGATGPPNGHPQPPAAAPGKADDLFGVAPAQFESPPAETDSATPPAENAADDNDPFAF